MASSRAVTTVTTPVTTSSPAARADVNDEMDHAPLRFDRRRVDRWADHGVAVVFELGGPDFGRRHVFQLLDRSSLGLGANCSSPLVPGTEISIAPQAPGGGILRGFVARCLPCGNGYRVAVIFERRMAA